MSNEKNIHSSDLEIPAEHGVVDMDLFQVVPLTTGAPMFVPHVMCGVRRRRGRPQVLPLPPAEESSSVSDVGLQDDEDMVEFEPAEDPEADAPLPPPIVIPVVIPPASENAKKCYLCEDPAQVTVDICGHYGFCVKCTEKCKLTCPFCRQSALYVLALGMFIHEQKYRYIMNIVEINLTQWNAKFYKTKFPIYIHII